MEKLLWRGFELADQRVFSRGETGGLQSGRVDGEKPTAPGCGWKASEEVKSMEWG